MELTIELLQELIQKKQVKKLHELFDENNIVDVAELVGELSLEDAVFIFKTTKKEVTAEVFAYLPMEKQQTLIALLTETEIKEILDHIYTDDIVDLLEELPANMVKDILSHASKQQRETINKLLSYPEYSAGSIMSTNFVELTEEDSVDSAMKKILKTGKQAETVNYCFVLDKDNVLAGMISLRDILFAPEEESISELMMRDVITVNTTDDQEEVVRVIQKYDITLVPVLDTSQRFVGVITADDVMDIMEQEATEDIQKMGAITPIEGSYLLTSDRKMAMSRLPWLLVLMVSYALSSMIITNNEYLLIAIPSLMSFVPMLMDTAGNAGSQALAMVVRGIVVDDLTIKDFFEVLWKELRVASLCGIILFVANVLRIVIFVPNAGIEMAFIVSLTVFLVVVMAKLVGGLLPLVAVLVKQDPAAMASPLITTVCDALSLTIFFGLAAQFLL